MCRYMSAISMIDQDRLSSPEGSAAVNTNFRTAVVHVCTSCRARGTQREPKENRAGFKLYENLRRLLNESPLAPYVEVKPAECLSLCPRPCGIALSSKGAWSYLFADQDSEASVDEIVKCMSLYLSTKEGFMPRERRPGLLRASVVGRIPPQGGLSVNDNALLKTNAQ